MQIHQQKNIEYFCFFKWFNC